MEEGKKIKKQIEKFLFHKIYTEAGFLRFHGDVFHELTSSGLTKK